MRIDSTYVTLGELYGARDGSDVDDRRCPTRHVRTTLGQQTHGPYGHKVECASVDLEKRTRCFWKFRLEQDLAECFWIGILRSRHVVEEQRHWSCLAGTIHTQRSTLACVTTEYQCCSLIDENVKLALITSDHFMGARDASFIANIQVQSIVRTMIC
jgi:hypothetical protein